jgi:hypothetical protein
LTSVCDSLAFSTPLIQLLNGAILKYNIEGEIGRIVHLTTGREKWVGKCHKQDKCAGEGQKGEPCGKTPKPSAMQPETPRTEIGLENLKMDGRTR